MTTEAGKLLLQDRVQEYVLNTNTMKFHLATCRSVSTIKPENLVHFVGTREEVIEMGYTSCGNCHS